MNNVILLVNFIVAVFTMESMPTFKKLPEVFIKTLMLPDDCHSTWYENQDERGNTREAEYLFQSMKVNFILRDDSEKYPTRATSISSSIRKVLFITAHAILPSLPVYDYHLPNTQNISNFELGMMCGKLITSHRFFSFHGLFPNSKANAKGTAYERKSVVNYHWTSSSPTEQCIHDMLKCPCIYNENLDASDGSSDYCHGDYMYFSNGLSFLDPHFKDKNKTSFFVFKGYGEYDSQALEQVRVMAHLVV